MRKLLAMCILVLLLFAMVSPINGIALGLRNQRESAISMLQQLCGNVTELPKEAFGIVKNADGKRNALCNKINAVISQVRAGAYNGSLNKLRNDLENAVSKWIVSPWRECLLESIEHIINCIKGYCRPPGDLLPPVIRGVFYYPDVPNYDDFVVVLTFVTDFQSGVANVILCYFTSLGENVNLTMTKIDGFYKAEIPSKPYNTNVSFLIYAWDKAENLAVSPIYSYTVGDFYPPIITYIERVPAEPNYNETVRIFANATEPLFASGIKELNLTYNDGAGWINVTMTLQEGLYVATIPELPYGSFVQYRVYAFDNAGNWAALDIYSYTVQDRFLPVAIIEFPTCGSYLAGNVNVEVYFYDDNFLKAELMVNETIIASWIETGHHTYLWNTSAWPDGVYVLKLKAYDQAGNIGENFCLVTVDNTLPVANINYPIDGSYVRGTVLVEVSGEDSNFDEMEFRVDDSIHVWKEGGSKIFVWKTLDFDDGIHMLALSVRDKAGNVAETSIQVTLDNTAPLLSNLTWSPSEPLAGEQVNVSIKVFEGNSGIKNVTLWYRVDNGEWNSLNMSLEGGNWTCGIPGQEENAIVTFYVDCYDNTGNYAATTEIIYTIKATGGESEVSGFPLGWLLLIIAIIILLSSVTVYYFKFRKKRQGF